MISGIHHVTAICSDPQRNLDFYAGLLGLRLVKRTVNFDDPSSHHLYYGDDTGSPGTIVTFFAWPGRASGVPGPGQATRVSFAIGRAATPFWRQRLSKAGIDWHEPEAGGGTSTRFPDPDGLALELVEDDRHGRPRASGSIGEEAAIRGVRSVVMTVREAAASVDFLTGLMGFGPLDAAVADAHAGAALGSGAGTDDAGFVVLEIDADASPGSVAVGSVHHVAWRVADDENQKIFRNLVLEAGIGATRVLDRVYFRSIYFREPGGVLFEVATDGPGFAADEPPDKLGSELRLPPWLEDDRAEIEDRLPPVELPVAAP